MEISEFRRAGHELVDWMADYLGDVERLPVTPDVQPGDIRRSLPASPPRIAEPPAQLMNDFGKLILPGMTHWGHPGFFAYFPSNASPPSMLAEMLTAALGAQCMSWQTSPAATELEQVTMEWLRQMLGLPEGFTGVIQDTSSTATLVALLTARERATGFAAAIHGLHGTRRPLTVYASRERHSSVDKAVRLAGYGIESLRLIDLDDGYAMRPDALDASIEADVAQGFLPAAVVATTGTTGSTRSIRSGPLARSARDMARGCTSMPPTPGRRPSSPKSAGSSMASNMPTASSSIRTSGCWSTSTAPPTS